MTRQARVGTALFGISAAAIALATLTPLQPLAPDVLAQCERCRGVHLSDLVANLILFLPLGVASALRGLGWHRAVFVGFILSAGVEVAQISFVPGRDATPVDLLMNTAGTGVGWWIVRSAGRWMAPDARLGGILSLGVATVGATAFAATGWLVSPSFPDTHYYAQWTPDLGYLEWYQGTVQRARVGPFEAPDGRFADSVPIRDLLLGGASIEVRARAGPPIPRLGSLFSVYDDQRREIVLIGPDRADLVMRVRTRAFAAGLDQPILNARGAWRGIESGDSIAVRVSRSGAETCLGVNDRTTCGLGFTVGRGWAFVQNPPHLPPIVQTLLGAGWVGGLTLLAGFWARRGVVSALGGVLLVAAAAAAPMYGLLATTGLEWAAGIAGWGLGATCGRTARRHVHRRGGNRS